jgi:ubiquinone/menaquinone biosynthesis C-methylase UbiE
MAVMAREADRQRAAVARAYAHALDAPAPPARGHGLARYDWRDVALLPEAVRTASLGCANPFAYAAVEPGQTVLDLGCGAGLDLVLAARRVGEGGRVLGVDMTPDLLARARAHTAGHPAVGVCRALMESLPVRDGVADWVLSNGALSLSPEKARVLEEVVRVLRPGGRVLLCDVVAAGLPVALRRAAQARGSCLAGALDLPALVQALRAAGLREVAVAGHVRYGPEERAALAEAELEDAAADWGEAEVGSAAVSAVKDVGGGSIDPVPPAEERWP